MKDLAYAFTLLFVTLGPLKVIPPFFLLTQQADKRTVLLLALRSTIVAAVLIALIALAAVSTLRNWRVSPDALEIAGGILLLVTSIRTLSVFTLRELPAAPPSAANAPAIDPAWLGKPVLSPLAIPAIVTPIGVVVILFFAGEALGDAAFAARLALVLLGIMALNFIAMMLAAPIMRLVGVSVLQVIDWVFSALQAGLAVQAIIWALRHLRAIP